MNPIGKIVVITGGTGGLGPAVIKEFLSGGNTVIITYLSDSEFEQMKSLPEYSIDRFAGYKVNLFNNEEIENFVTIISNRYGRIDILINIAGGFKWSGPVAEMNIADVDKMININFKTALYICRSVVPLMIKQGSGKIINIGSRAGTVGSPGMSAYAASKAALINFTQSLAEEVKKNNITVNILLPGTIDTAANRESMPGADYSTWVTPESITKLILFLASEESDDINGALVPIYGKG